MSEYKTCPNCGEKGTHRRNEFNYAKYFCENTDCRVMYYVGDKQ